MPGKSKVIDKDSKMCILTREKDEDGRVVKKFLAASNFVYKPVHQVMGAKDGYIMKVTTFPHNAQMNAFVPSNPKRDVFVSHLNKALHSSAGGLVCSLSENMFKNGLVRKICKFLNGDRYSLLHVTDVLGKIPVEYHEEDVYVLSDEVQITGEGVLIPASEREFAFLPDDRRLKASIKTPLSILPLQLAIPVMKLALKQNFVATMFTLGCFGMTMHADLVRKLDGSPTVVLVGPAGRGKTTGLLIAMACAGMHEIGFIKTASKEKILQRASQCSIGVFVDDPPNISALKELFIDFFNGASRETIARGQEKIRCGLMITANDTVSGSARELRRLVYVPYTGPSVMGKTAEEVAAHVAIKRIIHKGDFSSSVGSFIQLGSRFLNIGMDQIGEIYIPWVANHLDGCLADCILPYATAMWFSEQICKELFGAESAMLLKRYFEETIAPFVIAHQQKEADMAEAEVETPNNEEASVGPNLVTQFKEDVANFIKNGARDEILQAVRYGQTRGINCFVILPQFFADKNYDATTVNSHLKRCNLGSSQSRKIQKRSVRSTLLYTEAYEQEELDLLIQVLGNTSDHENEESLPETAIEHENEATEDLQHSAVNGNVQVETTDVDSHEVSGSLQEDADEYTVRRHANDTHSKKKALTRKKRKTKEGGVLKKKKKKKVSQHHFQENDDWQ